MATLTRAQLLSSSLTNDPKVLVKQRSSSSLHSGLARPARPFTRISNPRKRTIKAQASDVTTVGEPTTSSATSPSDWASFCAAASGEWDGITVTYDRDGEAQQLPEYYVPQAYRDWGVEMYDWQSQCSMLANEQGLQYCLRRVMPTVGCEADAVAFTEEQQAVFTPQTAIITPEGGYSKPPVDISSSEVFQAQADHCLPLSTTGQRVRIVHNLKRMGADSVWKILGVELHKEEYNEPYNVRKEYAGCGGGLDHISKNPALELGALDGEWKVQGRRYSFEGNGAVNIAGIDGEVVEILKKKNLIGLPAQAWSAAEVERNDAELAAGVVLEDGRVKMSVQKIVDGKIKSIDLVVLTK